MLRFICIQSTLKSLRTCCSTLLSLRYVSVKYKPGLDFAPGAIERNNIELKLKHIQLCTEEIPIVIGNDEIWTDNVHYQVLPYRQNQVIAKYCYATPDLINSAIENSLSARKEWEARSISDRAQIFFKAADVLGQEKRADILAAIMAGQAKNAIQAKIDSAPELIDFFRFHADYALDVAKSGPINADSIVGNRVEDRGLEGFVAAISPFDSTAIGGNLAGTPAMMGNVVLWKPSDILILADWMVYQILRECGLPPGVIQFLPADGLMFGDTVTASEDLAGINFTGSVPTFTRLWQKVGQNLQKYKISPFMAGDCNCEQEFSFCS